MKVLSFLFLGLLVVSACKQKPAATLEPVAEDTTKSYMPILDFLQEDLRKVDSFAGGILQKATLENRKDSSFITLEAFKAQAAAFLRPELDSVAFHRNFTENSFMDETSKLLNFIYTPRNDSAGLKKAIVYVSPSLSTDQVNRIYLETFSTRGDTAIVQKLTWRLRHYCIIAENKMTSGGFEQTTVRKLIWDASLFAEE